MVWYQLRYKVVRGKTIRTGGVVYKHLDDARAEAKRLLSVRDDVKDNRFEIWAVQSAYSSKPHISDMFVEAVEGRLKTNYTKKKSSKTNAFGLDLILR